MTRPPDTAAKAPPAPVDHDQVAAVDRLRAAFGSVEILAIHGHDPGPAAAPAGVQGCLLDPAVPP